MTAVEEAAPAKINLTLHVTGRRPDGYHLLDSLVVFADLGDRLTASPSLRNGLSVTGPMAEGVPVDDANLVLRAAARAGVPAVFTLEKHLPRAAGIGGGSSNAAAALRALGRISGRPGHEMSGHAAALGADVPVCLAARPSRMRGIGEDLAPVDGLPDLPAVLVNPGRPVATPEVFARLEQPGNAPMAGPPPPGLDPAGLARWLARQRNDLETPARGICGEVGHALLALAAQPGCRLARMSGSGGTCFGLFDRPRDAEAAARAIARAAPGWWVRDVTLRGAQ